MKQVIKIVSIILIGTLLAISNVKAQDGQIVLCEYEKDGKKVAKIQFNPITKSDYMPDINPDPGQWMIQYKKKDSDSYSFFQGQSATIGSFDDAFYQSDIINWGKDKTQFPESRQNNFSCPKYINIEYDGWWHRACFTDKGKCDGTIFEYNAELSTSSDTLYNKINNYIENEILKEYKIEDLMKEANEKYGEETENNNGYIMKTLKDKTKKYVKEKLLLSYGFNTTYATPNFIKSINTYIDNIDDHIDKTTLLDRFIKNAEDQKNNFVSDSISQGVIIGEGVGKLPNATPEEKDKINEDINKAKDKVNQNDKEIEKLDKAINWAKTAQTKIDLNLPPTFGATDCSGLLGPNVSTIITNIFKAVQYAGPILVILLTIMDFVKAASSGEADDMKKASNKLVKRLIAAILLFFVPLICDILLDFANITTSNNCSFK